MREQLPNPIRFLIDHIASWVEDSVLMLKAIRKKIIKCKQGRVGNGKSEWQYILNCSKIIAKLRESGLGDIEEFSDIPQSDLPENETTDIPIFNKADKQKNLTQALFDYMVKKAEAPVASISGTSETSKTSNLPEPKIVERSQKDQLETSKLPEPIELISRVVPDMPPKETVSFKSINEVSFAILISRA
ncbi:hypothetical protein C2G38_2190954 [Gigaspora rosea]|uniref:Uncharacterized protein n=1 Tax=Gigaspora rosea TaxID=44941 RepID=A0A397V9X7_9GLOM|nr:hypothetical protein C2G38_2190954 [Gigaspora rosea]